MLEPVIIAIDPDSKRLTAIVGSGDDWRVVRKVLPTERQAPRVMGVVWKWLYRLVKAEQDGGRREVHVFIERPFVSPKTVQAALPLCRLNGTMLAAAELAGAVTVNDVVIGTWKKDVVGKGNASKPEVATWAKLHWRNLWNEAQKLTAAQGRQDVCDAGAIYRHGINVLTRTQRISVDYTPGKKKTIRGKRLVR